MTYELLRGCHLHLRAIADLADPSAELLAKNDVEVLAALEERPEWLRTWEQHVARVENPDDLVTAIEVRRQALDVIMQGLRYSE